MAVAVGNTGGLSGNLSSGFNWSHTIGAGSNIVLIVVFNSSNGTRATGITFGGTSLTAVPSANAVNTHASELWYAVGVTGTETITVTHSGGMHHSAGASVDFNGGDTPSDGDSNSFSATTSTSIAIAAAVDDDYIVDGRAGTEEPTIGADQASYEDVTSGGQFMDGSTQDGAVSGDAMTWSFSSDTGAHVACRIPAAPPPSLTDGERQVGINALTASGGMIGNVIRKVSWNSPVVARAFAKLPKSLQSARALSTALLSGMQGLGRYPDRIWSIRGGQGI